MIIRSTMTVTKSMPRVRRAMVVAEHPLAAEAGAAVLAKGGNAVDAAIATAFATTVVEPYMSTVAGGASLLIHLAKRGETVAIDANVQAPAACHERSFALGEGLVQDLFTWPKVQGDANIFGARAVAVPGSVAGLCLALERYGTWDLADVLAPAIRLAEEGFVPDWCVALTMAVYSAELRTFPEAARTYLRDGEHIHRPPFLGEGDRLRQPDLAKSLSLLARSGPAAFYRGEIAERIQTYLQAQGGWLTREDLAGYAAEPLPPLTGRYRGVTLAFMPGATGGITALQTLNLLAEFPSERVGHDTLGGLRLRAAAVQWAYQERLRLLGDARAVESPWARLSSATHAAEEARRLRRGARPTPTTSAQDGGGHDCTTHVGVIDRQRNMVALTNTAVGLFGSRMVVPGTGILLNNGMIWFNPEPGQPNSVGSRKRPLVNMVPVLAFQNDAPALTLGAPGGRKIVSAIPQVLSNLIDLRETLQAAIEAPRLHTEGGDLWVDERVGSARLAGLKRFGYAVVPKEAGIAKLFFSRPIGIRIRRDGLEAGLDPGSVAAAAGM